MSCFCAVESGSHDTPVSQAKPLHKLRVLYVLGVPGVGGAQTHIGTVGQRLSRLGYRPAVVCNEESGLIARYSPWATVFPIPIAYGFSPGEDVAFFSRLLRLLRRERFDVVQLSAAKAGLYGRLAARLAGVPVIIYRAGGFPFHEFMKFPLRRTLILLEKILSRWATDMVISVSDEDRRAVVAAGVIPAHRITTIPNGVDVSRPLQDRTSSRQALGLAADAPVVGMVGRLSPQKAPADFLRLAARIVRTMPDVTFVVAGDGPLREGLELLAADLSLAGRVRFLGMRDDIPMILAALDVFVLTSLWEGAPFSVLEAMAAARPVVATAVNGVPEVIQHGQTGWLAAPGDVEQQAMHLEALLKDPITARKMGQAGRRRVEERFSLEDSVMRYSALYQSLYEDKKQHRPRTGASSIRAERNARETGQPEVG